ncbi:adenosylcobinamide-GDP ribazoletransferase [Acinetobacter sp. ANC 5054]|uniref:adenosylcobinamide-GDP ribazoletransferase n=1 Tax=Acinetobacter sp. ANC 5054 TaxID=1977877 RepID=UPI000A338D2C|nr:adenosylcobinamide-GDP ribazoletransferase [Acinetobacter sp. ANC 5054]OTG79497.1 adenosylcobinamide-GDP ribazoletransferase [Acinetobacter sp. ANC 5054]
MTPFLIALQFLTTFPIQLKAMPSKQQNGQSLLFYPVVGLLIGCILALMAFVLQSLPLILLSSMVLVLWVWLTGGLHLDGLADTADAWVGGFGDKERTLQIMKDPACGPIGVLSLVIICLLKWSAIYVLLQQQSYIALIMFPVLGRLAPLFLFLTTLYVREKGLGSSIAEYIPRTGAILIFLSCICGCLYFGWVGAISLMVFLMTLVYLRYKFIQRIDGVTGDTIGAAIEISEVSSLMAFVIAMHYLLN